MSEQETPRVVLGPLFTVAMVLGVYGLVSRRRKALVVAAALVAADQVTKLGHGLARVD